MRRRIDEVGSRPEGTTASGILSGGGAANPGGYVRTAPSVAIGSTVLTVPTPTNITAQVSNDLPSQPISGYSGNKSDMHAGVHHSVSNYTPSIPGGITQQGIIAGVDTGRTVVTATLASTVSNAPTLSQTTGQNTLLPHTQHGNTPTAIVRPRVNSGAVTIPPPVPPTLAPTLAACSAVVSNPQVAGQFQRLKVEDALSYLDQVKLRFGRQPQVYNDFLDIMKEFKSQSIDTPGVIARVSQLFRGHPELIVGFNTFLPPGYKIEVQGNDQVSVSVPGQQTTVVHTPQGVHHHITPTSHQATPPPTVTVKPAATAVHGSRSTLIPVSQHASSVASVGNAISAAPNNGINLSVTPSCGLQAHVPGLAAPLTGVPAITLATQSTGSSSSGGSGLLNSNVGSTLSSVSATVPHPAHREPPPPPPQASTGGVPPIHHHSLHQPAAQPVEFNHAINYVNKIKHRFQGQPDIYKQFLEILHTYQKEQKHIKEGGSIPIRTLTESEVYEKVAKLFENQEDLLQEFGQFLPDATNNTAAQAAMSDFMDQCRSHHLSNKSLTNDHTNKKISLKSAGVLSGANNILPLGGSSTGCSIGLATPPNHAVSSLYGGQQVKRPISITGHQQPLIKKPKLSYLKDMSAAEAGKFATLAEYAFFDRVRKALRQEETYHNFLRCITLFNEEIISRSELVQMIHPFLAKFPELLKWFKDFIGYREGATPPTDIIPGSVAKQERISGDLAMEIDYTTCKRLGASYCALPKTHPQPKCSGRNQLYREVLNDTWVSFPSWSEDSTFVTSRKTQYEEYIYRCEDERFELDVVLETNLATMRLLEAVQKKLQRMSPEEAARFRLDDTLGGSSPTLSQRAIKRIYGDKSLDIIDGLKKNPIIAVPLVLRRLKAKDEEWRDAQKGFNKVWREQNERYYLKSLDHQGLTFKQNDIKTLRSKSLLNEIETLYDERHEQAEEGSGEVLSGPQMVLAYKDKTLLDDAANLIIHHVKRQTPIHKEDKAKIKHLVRQFLPDLFFHPRMEMSDDEKDVEDDEDMDDDDESSIKKSDKHHSSASSSGLLPDSANSSNGSTSSKRKTRSNKGVDLSEVKEEPKMSAKEATESNCNGSKTKDIKVNNAIPNKITVNGDATEAEKNSIGCDMTEVKTEEKLQEELKVFSTAASSFTDDEYRLIFVNNNWFLFLRLHQILCQRLTMMYEQAVRIAAEEAKERKDRKESTAEALRLKPKNEIAVEDYYPALLDMVQNMLDGNLESTTFEDTLREMYGIHAYTAFTLDKVVSGAVRQLQHIVCDETPAHCMASYLHEAKKGAAGGPIASTHRRLPQEHAYQKKMEKLMQEENCFKIFTYKRDTRMTIELIDTDLEESEDNNTAAGGDRMANSARSTSPAIPYIHSVIPPAVAEVERWSEYVEKYATSVSPQVTPAVQAQLSRKPVFLPRNLRSWKRRSSDRRHASSHEISNQNVGQPMEAMENTQCKFSLSNYKMVFVVNSDSFMYKKQALQRARQSHESVSKRMKKAVNIWLRKWTEENVSEDRESATGKWFIGDIEGLQPNKTKLKRIDQPTQAPYSPYNKYECELTPDNPSS